MAMDVTLRRGIQFVNSLKTSSVVGVERTESPRIRKNAGANELYK